MDGVSPEVQAAFEQRLHEILIAQPWWRRSANTVVSAFTWLTYLASLALMLNLNLPDWGIWVIAAIFFVGGVIGIKKTRNGLTPSLIDLVFSRVGRHRPN